MVRGEEKSLVVCKFRFIYVENKKWTWKCGMPKHLPIIHPKMCPKSCIRAPARRSWSHNLWEKRGGIRDRLPKTCFVSVSPIESSSGESRLRQCLLANGCLQQSFWDQRSVDRFVLFLFAAVASVSRCVRNPPLPPRMGWRSYSSRRGEMFFKQSPSEKFRRQFTTLHWFPRVYLGLNVYNS